MPTSKRNALPDAISTTFAESAARELSRRSERQRELAKQDRLKAKAAQEASKTKTAQDRKNKVYSKEIGALFEKTKEIYDSAFGQKSRIKVALRPPGLSHFEEQVAGHDHHISFTLKPGADGQHLRFGMIMSVKEGEVYAYQWGGDIDPQYRGYPRAIDKDRVLDKLAMTAVHYGEAAGLKKMQKLTAGTDTKAKRARAATPR